MIDTVIEIKHTILSKLSNNRIIALNKLVSSKFPR